MNNLQTPSSQQDPEPEKQQTFHNTNNIVDDLGMLEYDVDSNCSTPYVSAPSSPGRAPSTVTSGGGGGGGYYYSAPASPMHFLLSSSYSPLPTTSSSSVHHEEFEFSARFGSTCSNHTGSGMSSADELFLNGQIRPMKLSTHLERPQVLAPLLDLENEEQQQTEDGDGEGKVVVVEKKFSIRGRDLRLRDKSLRRRTRSMSPMRSLGPPFGWNYGDEDEEEDESRGEKGISLVGVGEEEIEEKGVCKDLILECSKIETLGGANSAATSTSTSSASSSRSSSAGRSSKRWVFLKDFLRSKSEGRSNNKFWSSISFSPSPKDKRDKPGCPRSGISYTNSNTNGNSSSSSSSNNGGSAAAASPSSGGSSDGKKVVGSGQQVKKQGKPVNGAGKRRVPPSPHELHYTANRAQAEEMRKKTFLPYKQGLLGCLGFSSKGYGAVNGFARALNPVSSR